ncbi:MAG: GNAT family N-acetyltransferase [Nisaea sp.]|uniref:GNAT family N-acetyltransferase n=1 Tax=Nisaea sp. TaxID=2024842 RepID=UPI001B01AA5A|nr:GNAT family N-acetyltransferase [Nisaea sp.]MBO6559392.1 GNAT family N-acetyltransferase [Nisaea sp.]
METVTTERLAFRAPAFSDGDALYAQMNDFDIIKYLTSVPWPYKRADADAYIERARSGRAEGKGHYFLVIERASEAIVGTIDLRFDPEKTAHFGYWFAKSSWGRGYASEALAAILEFGFGTLGLENIWGAAMPENPASIRVMEKCGLRNAGMIEVPRPNFGDRVDMVKLDMRRADWLARSGKVPA